MESSSLTSHQLAHFQQVLATMTTLADQAQAFSAKLRHEASGIDATVHKSRAAAQNLARSLSAYGNSVRAFQEGLGAQPQGNQGQGSPAGGSPNIRGVIPLTPQQPQQPQQPQPSQVQTHAAPQAAPAMISIPMALPQQLRPAPNGSAAAAAAAAAGAPGASLGQAGTSTAAIGGGGPEGSFDGLSSLPRPPGLSLAEMADLAHEEELNRDPNGVMTPEQIARGRPFTVAALRKLDVTTARPITQTGGSPMPFLRQRRFLVVYGGCTEGGKAIIQYYKLPSGCRIKEIHKHIVELYRQEYGDAVASEIDDSTRKRRGPRSGSGFFSVRLRTNDLGFEEATTNLEWWLKNIKEKPQGEKGEKKAGKASGTRGQAQDQPQPPLQLQLQPQLPQASLHPLQPLLPEGGWVRMPVGQLQGRGYSLGPAPAAIPLQAQAQAPPGGRKATAAASAAPSQQPTAAPSAAPAAAPYWYPSAPAVQGGGPQGLDRLAAAASTFIDMETNNEGARFSQRQAAVEGAKRIAALAAAQEQPPPSEEEAGEESEEGIDAAAEAIVPGMGGHAASEQDQEGGDLGKEASDSNWTGSDDDLDTESEREERATRQPGLKKRGSGAQGKGGSAGTKRARA